MAATGVVRARIDEEVKEQASVALARMGLTVSDAIRLMLLRVAREQTLPFDVRPNGATMAAIEEATKGALPSVKTVDELMDALNADD